MWRAPDSRVPVEENRGASFTFTCPSSLCPCCKCQSIRHAVAWFILWNHTLVGWKFFSYEAKFCFTECVFGSALIHESQSWRQSGAALRSHAQVGVQGLADYGFGAASCILVLGRNSAQRWPHNYNTLGLCCSFLEYHLDSPDFMNVPIDECKCLYSKVNMPKAAQTIFPPAASCHLWCSLHKPQGWAVTSGCLQSSGGN